MVSKIKEAIHTPSLTSFDDVLSLLTHLETEVQLSLPNVMQLQALQEDLYKVVLLRMQKAAKDIAEHGTTDVYGPNAAEETAKFAQIAARIKGFAERKAAQINAVAKFIVANPQLLNIGGSPPTPPIDNTNSDGDDGDMLKRIEKLEVDVTTIKTDVAVIRSNYANKEDIAGVRTQLTEARLIFATKEEIHKEMNLQTWKLIGAAAALVAAVYFVSKPTPSATSSLSTAQVQPAPRPPAGSK